MRSFVFAGLGLFVVGLFFLSGWAGPIKEVPSGMTLQEAETYLSGSPVDELLPAQTYGYPTPQKVLELDRALGLTDPQRDKIETLAARIRTDAFFYGKKIIAQELLLDDYFRKGGTDPNDLANRVESIGLLRWRLRYNFLSACVLARTILTDEQLKKYRELAPLSPGGSRSR